MRESTVRHAKHLEADVVGASCEVLLDSLLDRLFTPGHSCGDEAVTAAAGEIVGGETQPAPGSGVCGKIYVLGDVGPGNVARQDEIPGHDHRLLGQQQRAFAKQLTGVCCVLGWDEIRVAASCALSSEAQHSRPKRSQQSPTSRHGSLGHVEVVEVSTDTVNWALVSPRLIPVHKRLVSGADPQKETIFELLVERRRGGSDMRGGAFPDTYDTRANVHPMSRSEHCRRRTKRIIEDSRHPCGAITKRLDLCGGVRDHRRRGRSKFGAPDSDTTDVKHPAPPPRAFRF
jgi:hypothetical protein